MNIFSTTARETWLKFGQKLPSTYLHIFRVLCSHQKNSIFISGLCLSTTVLICTVPGHVVGHLTFGGRIWAVPQFSFAEYYTVCLTCPFHEKKKSDMWSPLLVCCPACSIRRRETDLSIFGNLSKSGSLISTSKNLFAFGLFATQNQR